MDANKIIQHLVDISKGQCSITEDSILQLNNKEEQMIELGLLTLFEEVEFNKKRLENSNKEKDVLLKEIHHRVKNNLQIISSLLRLQNLYIDDNKAKSLLRDCRTRVNTMAVIHEMLYKTKDFGNVDYKEYLEELILQLKNAHSYQSKDLQIDFDIPSVNVSLDIAIPLGLLINEILTNSLKYGCDEAGKVEIYLRIREVGHKKYEMKVGDNGPGYSNEIFVTKENTLGIQLIRDLPNQLNGTIEKVIEPQMSGTHYVIHFNDLPT